MRLGELMKEQQLTQQQLANTLMLKQTSISAWLRGRSLPNATTSALLANYFGVSIEYFLGTSEQRTKKETADDGLTAVEKQFLALPPEQQVEALDYIRWRVQRQNTPERK